MEIEAVIVSCGTACTVADDTFPRAIMQDGTDREPASQPASHPVSSHSALDRFHASPAAATSITECC